MEPRTPRCRPLPPEVVAAVAAVSDGTPDSELLDRLEAALASLPNEERLAVVTAHGYGEPDEVVRALNLAPEDARSLAENALQLLRGALADVDPEPAADYGRLSRGRARPHLD